MSYLFNNQVKIQGTDAFSRLRISDTFTLAEYNHIYGDGPGGACNLRAAMQWREVR